MIRGIGVDAVNIRRLERWKEQPSILGRFFHPHELEAVDGRGRMKIPSLAARFAAKEAFGKALGTGLAGFALKEVAVVNDAFGKPELSLYGRAREAFERIGGGRIFVSLTHERNYAIAFVVIESRE